MVIIALFYLCYSCIKPENEQPIPNKSKSSVKLFVCNEGNFQWNNASLSVVNLNNHSIRNKVFKEENGFSLGDIAQSVQIIGSNLWVVMNNSGKIEILDTSSYKELATVEIQGSPRYLLPVSNEKAYLTELYQNCIWIIDTKKYTVIGKIKLRGWTENLVRQKGKIWISNYAKKYIYAIDYQMDKVVDSIWVGRPNLELVADKNENIYSLSTNESTKRSLIYKIENGAKTDSLLFEGEVLQKLRFNSFNSSLWYTSNLGAGMISLFPFNKSNIEILPNSALNYYGLLADSTVFLTDAKDFTQTGEILEYSLTGELLHSYSADIIPGNMLLVK